MSPGPNLNFIVTNSHCDRRIRRFVLYPFAIVGRFPVIDVQAHNVIFIEGNLGLNEGTMRTDLQFDERINTA
jgi:hypothetical protein